MIACTRWFTICGPNWVVAPDFGVMLPLMGMSHLGMGRSTKSPWRPSSSARIGRQPPPMPPP